jgi:hypothetical protein
VDESAESVASLQVGPVERRRRGYGVRGRSPPAERDPASDLSVRVVVSDENAEHMLEVAAHLNPRNHARKRMVALVRRVKT